MWCSGPIISFALLSYEPTDFEKVVKEEYFVQAINEDIEVIKMNETWDVVDLPTDKTKIDVK